jgi:hypothetical protein
MRVALVISPRFDQVAPLARALMNGHSDVVYIVCSRGRGLTTLRRTFRELDWSRQRWIELRAHGGYVMANRTLLDLQPVRLVVCAVDLKHEASLQHALSQAQLRGVPTQVVTLGQEPIGREAAPVPDPSKESS